jgi:hypothetical protein
MILKTFLSLRTMGKRRGAAALQDAKRLPVTEGSREASWSAVALHRSCFPAVLALFAAILWGCGSAYPCPSVSFRG